MLCKDAEAKKLAIGLMSGTSADGIDAVLVEISGCSTNTHVRQMAFVTLPFTDAVRSRILQVAAGNFGGSEELCLMNFLLGKLSADACLAVCAQAGVDPRNVAFVGSHGQTVFHAPVEQDYLGYKVRGTLQIGEASMIVEALGCPQIAAFDLSKEAVRLASKLVPDAAFCVGGSFCAPVRDGWADLLLNIFSPMAEAEFARMLRPGGHLVYAVPTARHLFGLKEILYDCPYENEIRRTEYDGFAFVKAVESTAVITLEGQSVQDLFAMTPYYWNTPADGAARLAERERLTTEIGFRFLVYQKV